MREKYYGLDDSQQTLEIDGKKLYLTVHCLYSQGGKYCCICIFEPPRTSHGNIIADLLNRACPPNSVVVACPHYLMYREVLEILPITIKMGNFNTGIEKTVYSRANRKAREISSQIKRNLSYGAEIGYLSTNVWFLEMV
ncbi:MAG: hypothetical protein QXM38_01290 [Candidatus Aenigmatarchaeota archaeon]